MIHLFKIVHLWLWNVRAAIIVWIWRCDDDNDDDDAAAGSIQLNRTIH